MVRIMSRITKIPIITKVITSVIIAMYVPIAVFATGGGTMPDIGLSAFIGLVANIVKLIGAGGALWGLVQVAMSIQSHDASQRSQGLLTIAGGLMLAFAEAIIKAAGITW